MGKHREFFCGPLHLDEPPQRIKAQSPKDAAQRYAKKLHFRDGITRVFQTVRVQDGVNSSALSVWDVKIDFKVCWTAKPAGWVDGI